MATFTSRLSREKALYQLLPIDWIRKMAHALVTFTSSLFQYFLLGFAKLTFIIYKRSTRLCVDLTVLSPSGMIPVLAWLCFTGSVQFIILIKVFDLSNWYQLLLL